MVNVSVATNRCASIFTQGRLRFISKLRFQYIKPLLALPPKSGTAVNSIAAKSIGIVSTRETLLEDSFDEEDIDNYRCVIPAFETGNSGSLNLTVIQGVNRFGYH